MFCPIAKKNLEKDLKFDANGQHFGAYDQ